MVNVLETAIDTIKSLTDEEKPQPLHVGEVMAVGTIWRALKLPKLQFKQPLPPAHENMPFGSN